MGHGLGGRDVVAVLERLRFERGLPQRIYCDCDNGAECVGGAMDLSAYTNGVMLDFGRRGKPTDNAAIESVNQRAGPRRVSEHPLVRIPGGWQQKIDASRCDYNQTILTELSRASALGNTLRERWPLPGTHPPSGSKTRASQGCPPMFSCLGETRGDG